MATDTSQPDSDVLSALVLEFDQGFALMVWAWTDDVEVLREFADTIVEQWKVLQP